MIKKKISLLVFICSALLFSLNLQYDLTGGYDEIIFWISIIVIFSTIVYQIFCLKYTGNVVLLEIFIVYLFLHLVYQVGYSGLRGSDSYEDYNFLKTILNNHNFSLGQGVDGWPMLHIFSSIIHIVTEIEPLTIAKFLPSCISAILVLPLYLLSYNIFRDKQVALFSCLVFGTIPQFMRFEGCFVRETFALFIMIFLFYIIYISKQRRDFRFALLSILLVPVIVFSHHFTSFMFIILLGIYVIASETISYFNRKNIYKVENLSGAITIKTISLVILVVAVSYWIYPAVTLLDSFSGIFREVTGVTELTTYAETIELETSPIVTLKGNIIYHGFFFFYFLFAAILGIKLILQKNEQKTEDFAFTTFFLFCGFYGFLALYSMGSLLFPQRFLAHGWLFGIIPLAGIIISLKKDWYKKKFVILLVSFMIFNVYNMNPCYYEGNPHLTGVVVGDKAYLIAKTIKFPMVYCGGHIGTRTAIRELQGREHASSGIPALSDFRNSTKNIIIDEEYLLHRLEYLKEKSKKDYRRVIEITSYKDDNNVNKICDSGGVYVLEGGG